MIRVETVLMERLAGAPPPPPTGPRVVVSRLDRGETAIAGSVPSLKIVLEGEEVYKIDGRVHRVTAGQILLVDGGAPYEATIPRCSTRGLCVYLPQLSLAPSDEQVPLGRAILRGSGTVAGGADLLRLAKVLHGEAVNPTDVANMIVYTATSTMLAGREETAQLMQNLNLKRPSARQDILNRLEMARSYLHANMDRTIPLAELATLAGISVFHFSRYFAAAFGAPPGVYHRKLRLNHARRMLQTRRVTATDAGEAIGYSEIAAFSNAFSREFGFPPSRA